MTTIYPDFINDKQVQQNDKKENKQSIVYTGINEIVSIISKLIQLKNKRVCQVNNQDFKIKKTQEQRNEQNSFKKCLPKQE
jgi:hypothetical protein